MDGEATAAHSEIMKDKLDWAGLTNEREHKEIAHEIRRWETGINPTSCNNK